MGRTRPAKMLTATRFRDGLRDQMLGTPQEWAELGPDDSPDPPSHFMRLNARHWCGREVPSDYRRQVRALPNGAGERLEIFWHRPSGQWVFCERIRTGACASLDLFKTLCTAAVLDCRPLLHLRRRL